MKRKVPTLVAMLMAPAVFGEDFDPVKVEHPGTCELDVPPEQSSPVHGPRRDPLVPDWDPVMFPGEP